MLAIMPKKKKTDLEATQVLNPVSFRPDHPGLIDALDVLAKANKRTRNATINLLIETALREAGLWPPKK